MKTSTLGRGPRLVLVLGIVLGILHQDFWWWADTSLVFGVAPVGLAYHILYSIMAAGLWALALRVAWPGELEKWAEEGETTDTTRRSRG